jgi:hypothetical protein
MDDAGAKHLTDAWGATDLIVQELSLRLAEHAHDTDVSHGMYEVRVHDTLWQVIVTRLPSSVA